jgi:hypothetical protein
MGKWTPQFLISAVDGVEWSASSFCRFTPGENPRYPLDTMLFVLGLFKKTISTTVTAAALSLD